MFVPRQVAIRKANPVPNALPNTSRIPSTHFEPDLTNNRRPKRPRLDQDILHTAPRAHQNVTEVVPPSVTEAAELVKSLELLFSEYFTQHVDPEWLNQRKRSIDGQNDYVHLSALLENCIFQTMKPYPTQKTLLTALQCCPSQVLQISLDNYHLRRHIPFEPDHTKSSKEYWDSSTIYIEPGIKGISTNAGRVARIITDNNSSLSVEWVESGGTAWAFVILSKNIRQAECESCENWPLDWIVMTKKEWQRRDEHYQQLRRSAFRQVSNPPGAAHNNKRQLIHHDLEHPTAPKSQHTSYTPGIIIYLNNLHLNSTKASIHSFLGHCVHRYTVKKLRKIAGTKKGGADKVQTSQDFSIDYVDYKPKSGFETAHVRVKTPADAKLLVRALKKRRRRMNSGDDTKGHKCDAGDDKWVMGEVIGGEREKAYWEAVVNAKGRKKTEKRVGNSTR